MKTAVQLPIWKRLAVGGLTRGQIIRKCYELNRSRGSTVPLASITVHTDLNNLLPHIEFESWALELMLMDEFVISASEEVDFIVATPEDLGFTNQSELDNLHEETFLACLANSNLQLCKPDDGPSIRMAYLDQPKGEWLTIAMEPIKYIGHNVFALCVKKNGDLLLEVPNFEGHPYGMWTHLDRKYVFRSTQKN